MHGVDLLLEHGTGKTKRTKNKVAVDEFPELENLRRKIYRICTIISNKKKKGLFELYDKFCLQFYGSPAPRIDVPNDTRISGTILMYQKVLRSRNLLTMFCANNIYSSHFVGNEITGEDWKILAEVIAVLQGIHVLVFQL